MEEVVEGGGDVVLVAVADDGSDAGVGFHGTAGEAVGEEGVDGVWGEAAVLGEDFLGEVGVEGGSDGLAHGGAFADDREGEVADGFGAEDAGGFAEEGGDGAGGVDAELAPGGGEEVWGEGDLRGGAVEEGGEGAAEGVGGEEELGGAAPVDEGGGAALGGAVDDDGEDLRSGEVGGEALAVLDAVLDDGGGSAVGAEALEPGAGAGGVVGFGGDDGVVDGWGAGGDLCGVGEVGEADVDGACRGVDVEAGQRAAGAEDELVLIGGLEQGCDDAADGADSYDCDACHELIIAGGEGRGLLHLTG